MRYAAMDSPCRESTHVSKLAAERRLFCEKDQRMLRQWLAMGLAVAVTASVAMAQDQATAVRSGGQRFSVLMKSKVVIQENQAAGQIVDVVFNDGGCIDYLVANYDDQYYAVPYSATQVRYTDQVVFINITPVQFRKVAFFRNNNWPDFYATNYRQQAFSFFNVSGFRNDGERRTFKQDLNDGDSKNRNADDNKRDGDKPKDGDKTKKDGEKSTKEDQPAPRTNRDPGAIPDGERSVNPKSPKKDAENPRDPEPPKPGVNTPKESPKEPMAKTPSPKPLPNPAPPLPLPKPPAKPALPKNP